MTDDMPDSLFKLRLSGALRKKLEHEASKRGLTLTGEILRRIDESFSEMSDRVDLLEKIVLSGEESNGILSMAIDHMSSEIETLKKNFMKILDHLSKE